jgi:methionine-gamma-lyase
MTGDVRKIHRLLGGNSNPFDAFLLSNGIKTLALRMDKHCNNAMSLAQYLSKHTQVAKVNYPGLPNHPSYTIASQQMKQFGSVMSVELKGGYEAATRFMDNLKLCTNAVSLGTCDTLISHPASTTHMGVSTKMRAASGITDGLIRISVGIENIDDIIQDFEQAFSATTN